MRGAVRTITENQWGFFLLRSALFLRAPFAVEREQCASVRLMGARGEGARGCLRCVVK